MRNVEVEMSRYIVGDRVKFLGEEKIYTVKQVETYPKMTYYLLVDEWGNKKNCYQARQIRKVK